MEQELRDESSCSTSLEDLSTPSKPKMQRGLQWTHLDQQRESVKYLVPASLGADPTYLHTFLETYKTCAPSEVILQILFSRYRSFFSFRDRDRRLLEQQKRAMTSILGTWMNLHPEDFLQPPEYRSLNLVLAYARLNMLGSWVDRRAQFLKLCMSHEPDMPEALGQHPGAPRELTTAPVLVPDAAAEAQPPEAMSLPGAQPSEEAATLLAVPAPGLKVVTALSDPQEADAARALLGTPEHQQPAAPAGGVHEGTEQHPAAAEPPPQLPSTGSWWLQPRRLTALTVTTVFVIGVGFIKLFNGFGVFFGK